MTKKSSTFASKIEEDYDEPTALAYTNWSDPMPILEGEAAERFARLMHEANEKAEKRKKRQMTKQEAEKELVFEQMFLKMAEDELEERKKRIKKLEEIINSNN